MRSITNSRGLTQTVPRQVVTPPKNSSGALAVQSLSRVWLFATPWTAARQASLSFTISQSLLKLMPIESVMPSYYLILCCPILLPSIFPSISLFQWVGSSHQVDKVWELQLQVDFCYNWLVWSPCCPRDSPESSPAPQFKSINSLALRLFYSPTLTSLHDY